MRSPGFQSSPMATVAMPSDVFFTSAISAGSAPTKPGRGHAQPFVRCQPAVVMQAAELQAVLGQPLHGLGGGPHQRRHRRVIQIEQAIPHRELVCIPFPKGRFRPRFFNRFRVHFLYNTKKGTEREKPDASERCNS